MELVFPSGHTAGAVAVARACARHYPPARAPAYAWAAGVAAAQVPRCAHYPSDVAGGALVGLAAEAAADRLLLALVRAGSGGRAAPPASSAGT